jgi:two-component system sensor histidine kinase TctE
VYRLRKKLENTGVAIVTLRGLGYLLEAKATACEARADASAGGGVTIRPNLRTQVALWLLLPLLGLLALDSWLTYQRAMSAAHVAFDRTLSSSLKSIREGVRLNDGEIEVDLPYLALEMFESGDGGKIYYLIRDDRGRTITGYPDLPLPRAARCSSRSTTTSCIAASSCGWPRWVPVHDVPSAQTRIVWVMVGETIEARQALAREILTGSLLQEGLLVVLALGIVWLGVGRGLRPLNRLSATVAARSDGDPTPLDTAGMPSELAPLVESINLYIARTQRMQLARRRFFADAAHQLKTPLAAVQAGVELALRPDEQPARLRICGARTAPCAGGEDRPAIAVAVAARFGQRPRGRASAGRAAPDRPQRDARLVAGRACARHRPRLRARRRRRRTRSAGPARRTDRQPDRQRDPLRGRPRGDHRARVARRRARAPRRDRRRAGHSAGERDAVFERFHRGSTTQTIEGTGLGLSIVREIARVHRGQRDARRCGRRGLIVTVWLSVLPEAGRPGRDWWWRPSG